MPWNDSNIFELATRIFPLILLMKCIQTVSKLLNSLIQSWTIVKHLEMFSSFFLSKLPQFTAIDTYDVVKFYLTSLIIEFAI